MSRFLAWVGPVVLWGAYFAGNVQAAPARFWFSSSPTDPMASINATGSLELTLSAAPTLTTGADQTLYLWAQPQTGESSQFQQLVTLTLNVVSTAPLVDFRSVQLDNPSHDSDGNSANGAEQPRFTTVRDSMFSDPLNSSLTLTSLAPTTIAAGTPDKFMGISAQNVVFDNPPEGSGIGPGCLAGDTTCQDHPQHGPIWRLASLALAPLTSTGTASLHLQMGTSSMLHADSYSAETDVIFAPPGFSGPNYNAGPAVDPETPINLDGSIDYLYRNRTLAGDAPDAILHVVDLLQGDFNNDGMVNLADYTVWRDNLGGLYNNSHYTLWKQHFGDSAGGSIAGLADGAPVPEPSGLILLAASAVAAVLFSTRRRSFRLPFRAHPPGRIYGLALAAAVSFLAPTNAGASHIFVGWTFEESQPATAGPHFSELVTVGEYGLYFGQALSFHAVPGTSYGHPAGNGSHSSFTSNNWVPGDYYQFQSHTTGQENVILSWDQTRPSTGPAIFALQYSLTGIGAFMNLMEYSVPSVVWSVDTYNPASTFTFDASSISELQDANNVYFRLTSLVPGATPGGTTRIDNFTLSGDSVNSPPPPPPPYSSTWVNPAGGLFTNPLNWQEGVVPGISGTAIFELQQPQGAPYQVGLDEDWSLDNLVVYDDAIHLDLGGHVLTTSDEDRTSIYVGVFPNSLGYLKLTNGTLKGNGLALSSWNDSTGIVELVGSDAHIELTESISGELVVGGGGTGRLTATDGSSMLVGQSGVWIGGDPGTGDNGTGTVEFKTGASLSSAGPMYVGPYGGNGTVNIESGAVVSNTESSIGSSAGSTGVVTVAGSGSQWNSSGYLFVGSGGSGMLNIENGGVVSDFYSSIGHNSGSTGVVTVTGGGSQWNTSGYLDVGRSGTGTLNVENGGVVSNAYGYIGRFGGSTGVVTVTGSGSQWTNTGNLVLGGTSLTTATTGTGSLTINDGGVVSVGGLLKLHAGGRLKGHGGTIVGDVNNAGRVAPGNSPGIITIDGDYTQTATGTLEIEIGGLTPGPGPIGNPNAGHDQLIVTGTATLGGKLEVPMLPGYTPTLGDSITFLEAGGGVNGTFAPSPFFHGLPEAVAHRLDYTTDPNEVTLHFEQPVNDIQFNSNDPTAEWNLTTTWSTGSLPGSLNIITVNNLAGVAQTLTVNTPQESPHYLEVTDSDISIAVHIDGVSFGAAYGTFIDENGAVELINNGTLSSQLVTVQDGGVLNGTGTVVVSTSGVNKLTVAAGGTVNPGNSAGFGNPVGHLEVQGHYQQEAGGALALEIAGDNSGSHHDSMAISGNMQLSGELHIDLSSQPTSEFTPGMSYEIATVDGSLMGSELLSKVVFLPE